MKCPKCEEELKPRFNEYPVVDADGTEFVEVFFDCPNEHQYFDRIYQTDLIED